jgi:hypothetical protein
MKKGIRLSAAFMMIFCLPFFNHLSGQQLAFPGAEGAGRFASGGRGTPSSLTTVFIVNSLADDNVPGTLRYAVNASTATYPHRTIVFRISGTIRLLTPLTIRANTTIAGQTAPGDGICIADQPVTISGNNVILRYLRIRMGDRYQNLGMVDGSGNGDALGSLGYKNIIIDHCSVSWSSDEALTIYRGDSTTIQWSMITEPLNYSYHFEAGGSDYQEHGYVGIWGARRASFHHNVLAHAKGRLPRFAGSSTYSPGTAGQENVNFYNNLVYNWQSYSTNGGEGGNYNLLNNYYKYGPNTSSGVTSGVPIRSMIMNPSSGSGLPYPKVFADGNYVDGYPAVTSRNWLGFAMAGGTYADTTQSKVQVPFDISPYNAEPATAAYEAVLSGAGATLPRRDTLDRRILNDIKFRTGKIIDVQGGYPHGTPFGQTLSAWPALKSKPAPADSDNDGMPDEWENANGLNPGFAADRGNIAPNGYTNLENYLNSIVNTNPEIYYAGVIVPFTSPENLPSLHQSYQVEGVNLPAAVTVLPPAGFEVSADFGTNWYSHNNPLQLNPSGSTLSPVAILVRLNHHAAGNLGGYLKHFTAGSDTTLLWVEGTVTSSTNYPVSLIRWPMATGNADDASARHPNMEPTTPVFKNFYVSNGTTVGAVQAYSSQYGQAFGPTPDGSADWRTAVGGPGGSLNRNFYEQFTIVPKAGISGILDSIVLKASFYNTSSNTKLAVVFSKSGFALADSTDVSGGIGPDGLPLAAGANGGFSTPVFLPNQTAGTTAGYRFALNGAAGVSLNAGESLTIRLYFSCGSSSAGRYAKLKDVEVLGRLNSPLSLGAYGLTGFTDDKKVVLQWQAAGTGYSGKFFIERSHSFSGFQPIGSLPANAATSPGSYRFVDPAPPSGNLQYRVYQVNAGGEKVYSRIVFISLHNQERYSVFPNPAKQQIAVTHPLYEEELILQIISPDGRVMHQQSIPPATGRSDISVRDFRPGIYRVIIREGLHSQVLSFFKY